jgi:hypothetical protein
MGNEDWEPIKGSGKMLVDTIAKCEPPNAIVQVYMDPNAIYRNAQRSEWRYPEYSNAQTDRYSLAISIRLSQWIKWEAERRAETDLPF